MAGTLGGDFKGEASIALRLCALPLAFGSAVPAIAIHVVAGIWFRPDRRVERTIATPRARPE